MLAYCAFKEKKYDECEDYIEEYQDGTNAIKDEEIEEAMAELITELKKIKKAEKHNVKSNEEMGQTGEEQAEF